MNHESGYIKDMYDVIIIGAGIGGLTCGCYLAKDGMKVLIVEQHNKPGGCCSSFTKQGIIFDAAVHTLSSCREDGLLGQVLDELDLRNQIKLIRMDPTNVIITKDYEIPIWLDSNKTLDILCNMFQTEAQNIKDFFKFITSLNKTNYHRYLKLGNERFGDLLKVYFNDKDLISILSVLLLNTGVPSSDASALVSLLTFKELLDGGYYPIDGIQGFSDTFAKKFIEFGGTLLLSTKVKKIEIEDKEVKGVRLIDNEYILAKYVISNCDARQTYFDLIGEEHLSAEFVNKINRLLTTWSFFSVYLGLNRSLPREDKRDGIIWYLPRGYIDEIFLKVFYNKESCLREGIICNLNPRSKGMLNGNPNDILYIYTPASYKDHRYWKENRERVADKLIARAEDIFPEISSSIAVRSICTPFDIERFTLNYKGATSGWACIPNQVFSAVIRKKTKINRLYMIGHWVNQFSGGGVGTVANIGQKTAKLIQRIEYLKIKGKG